MFFVISGYCIIAAAISASNRGHSSRIFTIARIKRIFPTYLLTFLLSVSISILAKVLVRFGLLHSSVIASYNITSRSLGWLMSNITLSTFIFKHSLFVAQAWSLCYELAFYLIIAAILWIATKQRSAGTMLWTAHGLTILILVWLIISPHSVIYPFDLWPEFGLGILLYHLTHQGNYKSLLMTLLIISVEIILLYALHFGTWNGTDPHTGEYATTYPFSLAFFVILYYFYKYDHNIMKFRITRVAGWLGTFSYTLYLTHLIIIGIMNQIIDKFNLTSNFIWLYLLLIVSGAIIFARIFYIFAEYPFISKSSQKRIKSISNLEDL